MRVYAFDYYRRLAENLLSSNHSTFRGVFCCGRFPNGELFAELEDRPTNSDCIVLGSMQPPEKHMAELLLLCDTLHGAGAKSISVVMPYLAYSRQDRWELGVSLGAAWAGRLLQACGVNQVLTLDIHSKHVAGLFPIPLGSLPTASILADAMATELSDDTTIVAPDEGAIQRSREFVEAAQRSLPTAHFHKVRSPKGVESKLVGSVSRRAVVVDDILDTGATLVACCNGLKEAGVEEIFIAVSHGLFTGRSWLRLWELGVKGIVCTDSVAHLSAPDPRVRTVSCAPTLVSSFVTKEAVI